MSATDLGSLERDVAREEAFEAVCALKARYFRLMDEKDWGQWEALYAPDAVMDMRGEATTMASLGMDVGDAENWVLRSSRSIREAVAFALDGVTTVHHGHMAELGWIDEKRISAVWSMEDVIRYPPGRPIAGFNGYGHYHDTYVFDRGRWLIESTMLKRLHVSPVPHPD